MTESSHQYCQLVAHAKMLVKGVAYMFTLCAYPGLATLAETSCLMCSILVKLLSAFIITRCHESLTMQIVRCVVSCTLSNYFCAAVWLLLSVLHILWPHVRHGAVPTTGANRASTGRPADGPSPLCLAVCHLHWPQHQDELCPHMSLHNHRFGLLLLGNRPHTR